jgi:molybdate transport system ATP-binding protein
LLEVTVSLRRGDFDLEAGFATETPGVTALFGRSGSGKTTLVNLIAGLLTPDRGRIAVDGTVLHDSEQGTSLPPQRRRIGYVFQDPLLFPHLDVEGNLRYGQQRATPRGTRAELIEAAELLGLHQLLARRPHQLSGGERQRVALGRALLSRPRLLLLDEPLASLDAARREELLPWFEALRDRHAIPIVYVSHEFEEVVRLASHVILLERGRVAAQGDVGHIAMVPELRAVLGPELVGAVVDGRTEGVDPATGLAKIRIGHSTVTASGTSLRTGQTVRLQLLARDLILATVRPAGLSVRNEIEGSIRAIIDDGRDAVLVEVDVGGTVLLARVTRPAAADLALERGRRVWVLVKALSLRGHVFGRASASQGDT